jgi:outer membrane protein assembly factor BamC
MMKSNVAVVFVSAAVLLTVPACSYIQGLFPDKERDYQYTTEIAPLHIPAGLGKTASTPHQMPTAAAELNNSTATVAESVAPLPEAPTFPASETTPPLASTAVATEKSAAILVDLVKANEGVNQLTITAPFDKAWRVVDKALGRQAIEITERDKEAGRFAIRYGSEEQKREDGSFWNEVEFIFGGFQSDEKVYTLKVSSDNQQTTVIVLDDAQKPLSDASSLSMLSTLQKTIQSDSTD